MVPRKDPIQAVSTRAEVAIDEVAAVGINRSGRGRRMDPRGGLIAHRDHGTDGEEARIGGSFGARYLRNHQLRQVLDPPTTNR